MHRWYDPHSSRWISEDPIGFAAGDANLYRYVGNEVTDRTDPEGLDWRDQLIPAENNLKKPLKWTREQTELARDFWFYKVVVGAFANYKWAAEFLGHSLQDFPHNRFFLQGTELAASIKGDKDFRETIRTQVLAKHSDWQGHGKFGAKLATNKDLSLAIHGYTLHYRFVTRPDCRLEVAVTDRYDFEGNFWDWFFVNGKAGVGVNLADADEASGVIQRYETLVKIDFTIAELDEIESSAPTTTRK